jgi:hypothetical protein
MDNPRIRFWTSCLLAASLSFVVVAYLTAWAPYLIFIVFVACLLWVIAAHAKFSGGLSKLSPSKALIVSAGTSLALLFSCGLGAFLAIGKLTGFQD